MLGAAFQYQKKCQRILELEMVYLDEGQDDPIGFLDCNPNEERR